MLFGVTGVVFAMIISVVFVVVTGVTNETSKEKCEDESADYDYSYDYEEEEEEGDDDEQRNCISFVPKPGQLFTDNNIDDDQYNDDCDDDNDKVRIVIFLGSIPVCWQSAHHATNFHEYT